jgi:hypothetical protein
MTHRDDFSELSVRSPMRGDAGHRKGRATRSESSEKTQALSPLGRVGGRQQALEMTHIAPGSTGALLPTRRDPGAIPMGQYHQDLVLYPHAAKLPRPISCLGKVPVPTTKFNPPTPMATGPADRRKRSHGGTSSGGLQRSGKPGLTCPPISRGRRDRGVPGR